MEPNRIIRPGEFEAHRHWYPKALNANIHPTLRFFLNLDAKLIVSRYCRLHPTTSAGKLSEILDHRMKYFLWAGADLFHVSDRQGNRQMVILENNSCPAGQEYMPLIDDQQEQGSYRLLVERTFKPFIKNLPLQGGLAVIYDRNPVETSGYAEVIADVMNEVVHYVRCRHDDPNPRIIFREGVMHVRTKEQKLVPIRAAFKFITKKPWKSIPLHTKTKFLNPIVVCLAGGRNKLVAAKAYGMFNAEYQSYGLRINMPETISGVTKNEVPHWVAKMGGQAVVKIPYGNSGQGVYTIVSKRELENFMKLDFSYDLFVVQSLVGNVKWRRKSSAGQLHHLGTIPDQEDRTYAADVRMMVSSTDEGVRPLCTFARRARKPLGDEIPMSDESWEMLGTNLSYQNQNQIWQTDNYRLLLMDTCDFNKLGIGLDDLIETYIQTVLSMFAIDNLAVELMDGQDKFRMSLFKSMNDDNRLLEELLLE